MTTEFQQRQTLESSNNLMTFEDVVRNRRSIRSFLDTPVPENTLHEVLQDAQYAPSNCNTQPWHTHIVSGEKLKQLSELILTKHHANQLSPDFSFDTNEYHGDYQERFYKFANTYYSAMGAKREDKEKRAQVSDMNYSFFNAPSVALLFMPSFGDDVRVAGDIGMYGQTFLLSLAAHGLGGIPQTSLGFFAGDIREFLGIPKDLKLLFGISFGYPDEAAAGNSFRTERSPIEETVTFHN